MVCGILSGNPALPRVKEQQAARTSASYLMRAPALVALLRTMDSMGKQQPTELAASTTTGPLLAGYDDLLRDIKERVKTARVRAALAVNRELVLLYWGIGRDILQRQQQ